MRIISCMLLAAVFSGNAVGQNPEWDVPYQPSLLEWSVVKTNIDTTDVLNRMFIQRGENVRLWLTAMRGKVDLFLNYDSQIPENITKEEFEAFKEWATNSVIVSLDQEFLTHALLMKKNGQDLPNVLSEFIDNYPWVKNSLRGFLNGEAISFSAEGDEYLEAKRLYKLKVNYVPLTRNTSDQKETEMEEEPAPEDEKPIKKKAGDDPFDEGDSSSDNTSDQKETQMEEDAAESDNTADQIEQRNEVENSAKGDNAQDQMEEQEEINSAAEGDNSADQEEQQMERDSAAGDNQEMVEEVPDDSAAINRDAHDSLA